MTSRLSNASTASRGEIWNLRFDPSEGAEMTKIRPAVVISIPAVGRLPLRIVAPVTEWKDHYSRFPWLVRIVATKRNRLAKDSAADAFQVKSVSLTRFVSQIGSIAADDLQEISAAVALCVGA